MIFDLSGRALIVDAMSRKSFIMIAMVGGYVSGLLGADSFFALLAGSTIGSLLGIWGAFKLHK
jgi:hypothetical protein